MMTHRIYCAPYQSPFIVRKLKIAGFTKMGHTTNYNYYYYARLIKDLKSILTFSTLITSKAGLTPVLE